MPTELAASKWSAPADQLTADTNCPGGPVTVCSASAAEGREGGGGIDAAAVEVDRSCSDVSVEGGEAHTACEAKGIGSACGHGGSHERAKVRSGYDSDAAS